MSWWQLSKKPFIESLSKLTYESRASPAFLASSTAGWVNPRKHGTTSDRIWQAFDSEVLEDMDDRQILSLFTKGFFGGYVFALEGIALKCGGWRICPVGFTGFSQDEIDEIWSSTDIPLDDLCPTGTKFFGVFQLLDQYLCAPGADRLSFVDYGFCSDKGTFAGAHRFSVKRSIRALSAIPEAGLREPSITISLEGFTCNPQKNEQVMPGVGLKFHALYARLLFANGIESVLGGQTAN
ncbi:hypothetical protein N7470_003565 [Penicillium chermesinum]|nr:hypothetical protein N7470_003565 [Penicillium chermesinum]